MRQYTEQYSARITSVTAFTVDKTLNLPQLTDEDDCKLLVFRSSTSLNSTYKTDSSNP